MRSRTAPAARHAGSAATLRFATQAYPDVTPPGIVEGPYILSSDDVSAAIRWLTDEPATSRIEFGVDPGDLSRSISAQELTIEHVKTLTGLDPSTVYHYQVLAVDGEGNGPTVSGIRTFTTDGVPDTRPPAITSGPTPNASDVSAEIDLY